MAYNTAVDDYLTVANDRFHNLQNFNSILHRLMKKSY